MGSVLNVGADFGLGWLSGQTTVMRWAEIVVTNREDSFSDLLHHQLLLGGALGATAGAFGVGPVLHRPALVGDGPLFRGVCVWGGLDTKLEAGLWLG